VESPRIIQDLDRYDVRLFTQLHIALAAKYANDVNAVRDAMLSLQELAKRGITLKE